MRPINETTSLPPDNVGITQNDVGDKTQVTQDKSPKMQILEEKSILSKQEKLSQVVGSVSSAGESHTLPSSDPVVSPRGQATVSAASSSVSKAERKVDQIGLENHVSLQIFSTDETKKNKNAILFLHGGPGLAYDDSFENMTSWSLEQGYTLVAPEIAGSDKPGLSGTSDSFANPPNYVRDLQSVVKHLRQHPDFKEKEICVVAHSWGGFQLASFLTDKNISSEDKSFFKQVVFISPNLNSAHTRIFASNEQFGGLSNERQLHNDMTNRHAGANSNSTENITFINNPVMNENLNQKISPFYRLEEMPKIIPCLFVHPSKDKTVPLSQSLAAVEKINSSAGNARIVIPTDGGHTFFKTGNANNPDAMTACLGAIDSLIKEPDSLATVTIDKESSGNLGSENIELKVKEKDGSYKSQKNLLDEWHSDDSPSGSEKMDNKRQTLMLIKTSKERTLKIYEERNLANNDAYKKMSEDVLMINKFLESL